MGNNKSSRLEKIIIKEAGVKIDDHWKVVSKNCGIIYLYTFCNNKYCFSFSLSSKKATTYVLSDDKGKYYYEGYLIEGLIDNIKAILRKEHECKE